MTEFIIGKIIKKQRYLLEITQEKLCDGICSKSTLSKIERLDHQPSRYVTLALLERLGVLTDRYYGVRRFEELEIEEYKLKIKAANGRREYKNAILLMNEMIKKYHYFDRFSKQFLIWMNASNGKLVNDTVIHYSDNERLEKLKRAITLTVPKYNDENINKFLLGFNETQIILSIANTYSNSKNTKKAISIYNIQFSC